MRMILVYLPLVVLAIGFLFGKIRVGWAAATLVVWLFVAELLIIGGMMVSTSTPGWGAILVAIALFMVAIAIPTAILFGSVFSKPVSPMPIEVVAEATATAAGKAKEAYDGLDPEDQRRVCQAARLGVKFGLRTFADFLSRKGHESAAKATRTGAKLV